MWLNADVLPGPGADGARAPPLKFAASEFIALCRQHAPWAVLSLGFRGDLGYGPLDCRAFRPSHVEAMLAVSRQAEDALFVFAMQARLAARGDGVAQLRKLLRAAPKHEILLWTGTGEPPISAGLLTQIKRRLGREDALRVTYDCHEVASFGDWCHLWAYRLLYPALKLLGVY